MFSKGRKKQTKPIVCELVLNVMEKNKAEEGSQEYGVGAGLTIVCRVWTGKDTGRKWYLSNDLREGGGRSADVWEKSITGRLGTRAMALGGGKSLAGPSGRNGEQGGNQAGVGRLSLGQAGETAGVPWRNLSI